MARRTGLRTIRELAHQMCRLVVRFTPTLQAAFPDSPALQAALVAANAACAELVIQADLLLEFGD